MSSQPAFCVTPTSVQTNITAGDHVTVVFGTEIFDQNSDFSSNTFTAPVTGRYQLNAQLYVISLDSVSDFYQARIVTSNRNYEAVFDPDFGQDAVYWAFSINALADMDAGDTVTVSLRQQSGTSQTDIDNGSRFSGYLVA